MHSNVCYFEFMLLLFPIYSYCFAFVTVVVWPLEELMLSGAYFCFHFVVLRCLSSLLLLLFLLARKTS